MIQVASRQPTLKHSNTNSKEFLDCDPIPDIGQQLDLRNCNRFDKVVHIETFDDYNSCALYGYIVYT